MLQKTKLDTCALYHTTTLVYIDQTVRIQRKYFMAMVSEEDQRLLEQGLGNVTWWGFSPVEEFNKHFPNDGGKNGFKNSILKKYICTISIATEATVCSLIYFFSKTLHSFAGVKYSIGFLNLMQTCKYC